MSSNGDASRVGSGSDFAGNGGLEGTWAASKTTENSGEFDLRPLGFGFLTSRGCESTGSKSTGPRNSSDSSSEGALSGECSNQSRMTFRIVGRNLTSSLGGCVGKVKFNVTSPKV